MTPTVSGTLSAMSAYLVSESRVIAAEPQRLFDIVADPAMHPAIDGSGSVQSMREGSPERLSKGAKFGMEMKLGAPYKITNTVVEFVEGKQIAWRHFNGHVWRYVFEPVDGGTRVTEQWDARPARNKIVLRLTRFPERNRKGILATLQRLDDLVTAQ
jgi:polyketide cyclase/dehydrase/lipid transport protein